MTPFLAMECCLFPLTSQIALPYEAKWCFKDLTHGKELTANVQSQMIYQQGHSMYHVQLTAVGPPTVNINQKVADMLAQKQLDAEDIPILPKDEQKSKSEGSQNVKEPEHPIIQQLPIVQPVQENITKESSVDGNADNKKNTEPEKIVNTQDPAVLMQGEPVKKYTILRRNSEDKNKKELLPSLLELSIKPPSTIANDTPPEPGHSTEDTKNDEEVVDEQTSKKLTDSVANVSHDATKEISNKTTDALSNSLQDVTEKSVKKPPSSVPEYIPVGFLNDQMYQSLLDEFSTASSDWYAVRSKLRGARFFAVRGNTRQIIEAIKTKVWCTLDERFALHLNQVYREQTAKQAAMYLIFVQRNFIVGFIQVVSERKPQPCSVLTPAVLWGQQCRGEFKIKVISIYKYKFHLLNENAEVLWRFMNGFPIVQELHFDVAEEIVHRYENLKRQYTILEWGLKNYQHQNAPLKELTDSQENLFLPLKETYLPEDAPKESKANKDNLTEDEDQCNEDWEPDLQAQPAKVAEIYSNISSPPASTSSRVEEETIEDTEAVPEEANVYPRETVKPLEEDEVFEVEPVELEEAFEEKPNLDDEGEQEEFVSPGNLVDNTNSSGDVNQADEKDSSLVNGQKDQKQPESNEQFENNKQEKLPIREEKVPSSLNEESTPQATITQPLSAKDDLLPSYMPYGQAVPGNDDTHMKDQDNLTNENLDMKEHFYVVSPPQTPKTDVPREIFQDADKEEISKDELSQEELSSNETKANERVSSTSASSLTNEVSSSDPSRDSPDFLQVAECTQVDADVDDEESFLPVEKGGRYKVFAYKEPDDNGAFWVRLVRNDKDEEVFRKFQRTLNKLGRTSEPVAHVHLYKNCIFINHKGYSFRGLITKVHDGNEEVDVRLIDDGKSTIAAVSDLRELDKKYVTDMAPQAFECRLRDKNLFKEKFKKARKNIRNFDIEIEVMGFIGEVVEVDVISLKLCERTRHYKPPLSR